MHFFISSWALGLSRVFLRTSPHSRCPPPLVNDWNSSLLRLLSGSSIHCTEAPFLGGLPRVRVLGGRETECRAPHGAKEPPTTSSRGIKMEPPSWGDVASEWVSELEVDNSFKEAPLSLPLSASFPGLGSSHSALGDTVLQAGPATQTKTSLRR